VIILVSVASGVLLICSWIINIWYYCTTKPTGRFSRSSRPKPLLPK
jgi:hypothetical protein